jgi:hypothetical protein
MIMEYETKQNRLLWLPSWQREIIARYTSLYRVPSRERARYYAKFPEKRPPPEDYCNLRYGFECREGWAKLIEELSKTATSLVRVLRAFGFQDDAEIAPVIMKEKIGTLRWQGDSNLLPPFRDLWNSFTADIQHRSAFVCEISGYFGGLRDVGHGMLQTLSDAEYEKELLRRAKRQSGRESGPGGSGATK